MDLFELSTLSFDYGGSVSSSEASEPLSEVDEQLQEVTYQEDGRYVSEEVEDPKLKNWNKWIKYRKRQQQHLSKELNRESDKMVMNSEDVYEKRRNAQLINSAYTYFTFDKYRGDPKFWRVPDYMYDDKDTVVNCPVQDKFDRTVVNKNEPPVLEYVGIPQLVKYEKGLINPEVPTKPNATVHKCDYLTDRKLELLDNVGLIDPYTPDVDNLYVQGTLASYMCSRASSSENDYFLDTAIVVESVPIPEEDYNTDKRFPVLKIQGKYVDKSTIDSFSGDFHIIRFLNSMVNELRSETLTIENIGNVSVRYSWEQFETYKNPQIPLRYSTQLGKRIFFLPKRDVILPGQIIENPILFRSREPGVYCEYWKMVTDPKFAKDKFITLSLRGCVRSQLDRTDPLNIESYIKKCQVTSVSRYLLDTSFVDSTVEGRAKYDYLFMFKDIFLHCNPHHFYDVEKVNALVELHKKVSGDKTWDLSIITLRNNIYNNVKILDDRRKYLVELYELSNSLLTQTTELNINNEKYRCVYQILCSFANMIDLESQNLRRVYGVGEFQKASVATLESIEEESISSRQPSRLSNARRSQTGSLTSRKGRSQHSSLLKLKSSSTISASLKSSRIPSQSDTIVPETDSKLSLEVRTGQYVKTLCIKTYKYLSDAVDEITAALESLNMFH